MKQGLPVCSSTKYFQVLPSDAPLKLISLRAALFFDGTLNNMRNTFERELAEAGIESPAMATYGVDDSSYRNDYTNVALLSHFVENRHDQSGTGFFGIYVEGIGTIDLSADSIRGYALGSGVTGITGKVQRGMTILVDTLRHRCEGSSRTQLILKLDVFGFSRGAAAARHFIHVALHAQSRDETGDLPTQNLRMRLAALGIRLARLDFGFAGLFDTVASYGIKGTIGEVSCTSHLHLDAIRHAETVVHITAQDEHRGNFALTDIQSAGIKGKVYCLPGVHCDIGGSYLDHATELFSLLNTFTAPACAATIEYIKHHLEYWINGGWFRWQDVLHRAYPGGLRPGDRIKDAIGTDGKVRIFRAGADGHGLRNKYSLVSLHLMLDEATALGMRFKPTIYTDSKSSVSSQSLPLLTQALDIIRGNLRLSRPAGELPESLLRNLRMNYFHFSANYDKPLGSYEPRFIASRPERLIHKG